MIRHRPSDHGRVVGDGGSAGGSAPVEPAGFCDPLLQTILWDLRVVPLYVARWALALPCGEPDPVSELKCEKPPGHHLFTDRRRWHRAEEPNQGLIADTYPATWVHLWTSVRSVTTNEGNGGG